MLPTQHLVKANIFKTGDHQLSWHRRIGRNLNPEALLVLWKTGVNSAVYIFTDISKMKYVCDPASVFLLWEVINRGVSEVSNMGCCTLMPWLQWTCERPKLFITLPARACSHMLIPLTLSCPLSLAQFNLRVWGEAKDVRGRLCDL